MKPISMTVTSAPCDADDAPVLTQDDFDRARFRVAGRDVSRAEWQAAARAPDRIDPNRAAKSLLTGDERSPKMTIL